MSVSRALVTGETAPTEGNTPNRICFPVGRRVPDVRNCGASVVGFRELRATALSRRANCNQAISPRGARERRHEGFPHRRRLTHN